jgi:hypothetical protein
MYPIRSETETSRHAPPPGSPLTGDFEGAPPNPRGRRLDLLRPLPPPVPAVAATPGRRRRRVRAGAPAGPLRAEAGRHERRGWRVRSAARNFAGLCDAWLGIRRCGDTTLWWSPTRSAAASRGWSGAAALSGGDRTRPVLEAEKLGQGEPSASRGSPPQAR